MNLSLESAVYVSYVAGTIDSCEAQLASDARSVVRNFAKIDALSDIDVEVKARYYRDNAVAIKSFSFSAAMRLGDIEPVNDRVRRLINKCLDLGNKSNLVLREIALFENNYKGAAA